MSEALERLAGQSVAVWGVGREGRAVLNGLPLSCTVSIIDDDPGRSVVSEIATEHRASTLTPLEATHAGIDVVVRSPGVSLYRDELIALTRTGARITSLLELWLPHAPARTTIGVTGTKGKSTTSSIIASLLEGAGHSVEVAGNIGIPVTNIGTCDFAVVEVSSYQAAGICESPDIGVLTNLDADHLSWHKDVGQYHRDKLQLFANPSLNRLVVPPWSTDVVEATGIALDWEDFCYSVEANGTLLSKGGQSVAVLGGSMFERLYMAHNLAVACVAVEQAIDDHLDPSLVRDVVRSFKPLPGRLEIVPTQDGITWVNDPLASNPMAAAASIQAYRDASVVLIIGGEDRGVDPSPLVDAVRNHRDIRAVIALHAAGAAFRSLIEPHADVRTTTSDSLEEAVVEAAHIAREGDTVLFSPAAPTPTGSGDWETRLAAFEANVKQVAQVVEDES